MSAARDDELTATLEPSSQGQKTQRLLETSLSLIEAGSYGDQVEKYLETYLRTPGLLHSDVTRALLARGNARKAAGERLLMQAQQDLLAVTRMTLRKSICSEDPHRGTSINFLDRPASQRIPVEIWENIAQYIPRHHLRTWLFVSPFHQDIAARQIFRTVDIYFCEDQENANRGLDIFDRVKADPVFASRIRTLRLHWAYEEGDMLDLMLRLFRTALPALQALRELEWIGYPEMRADMVQAVLSTHRHLESFGLIGWHFDAVGVSAFRHLRKFCLRAEDDDGFADMGEVCRVLDCNADTLRRLTLGAHLQRAHSWDGAVQSAALRGLTHLDLVDTRISRAVLVRVAQLSSLRALTLHGTLAEPAAARAVFASDRVVEGRHTVLPLLEAFRFVVAGHDDDRALYQAVAQFVRQRPRMRRLDLGRCPWELVRGVLPDCKGLRVLRVRMASLSSEELDALVSAVPQAMQAIHLETVVATQPLHDCAASFRRFSQLSMLHLRSHSTRRPQPNLLSQHDLAVETERWMGSARTVAQALPSLDFLGWYGEHYVVLRSSTDPSGKDGAVELKELPARRRLDCGKGVDLGGEDAAWMERKDVPTDYEMAGLEA